MPVVLHALLADVDDATWRAASIDGEWSALEIICHMCDEEVEDFRARLAAILQGAEELALISPEDWPDQRYYHQQNPATVLAIFADERARSLAWLSSLDEPADAFNRYARHSGPGAEPLSGFDILAGWVTHDHLHGPLSTGIWPLLEGGTDA